MTDKSQGSQPQGHGWLQGFPQMSLGIADDLCLTLLPFHPLANLRTPPQESRFVVGQQYRRCIEEFSS